MKNHKLSIHIIISIAICVFLLLKVVLQKTSIFNLIINAIYSLGEDTISTGVIGGSDGPTTIFISSPSNCIYVLSIIEFIGIAYVLFILITCYQVMNQKDKK